MTLAEGRDEDVSHKFGLVLVTLNGLLYWITYSEGQAVLGVKGQGANSMTSSFKYDFTWVLPYWWIIILGIALVLSGLYSGVRKYLIT